MAVAWMSWSLSIIAWPLRYFHARMHGRAPTGSGPAVTAAAGDKSTITADMVTGSHVLRISGYSGTKGLGVGKSIRSGRFNVGDHSWCIRYYPDGLSGASDDWISVDLCLEHPCSKGEARALIKLSVLDQSEEPVISKACNEILTFTRRDSWGFDKFITRKELESSSHLKDDSFQIRCDVTVVKEIRTEIVAAESLTVPPSDLHKHFGALLASEVGGDLTLEVGGQLFTAHRYVLAARSSVFMAGLFGPMEENTEARVRIEDMEPRVFKALLHFIYTDSLPEMNEGEKNVMAQHLLVAADRYSILRLKLICENMLLKYINTNTTSTILVLAEQHGCHGLKERCFKFLRSPGNMEAVMASDGFKHLRSSCPSLLEELLAKVTP